MFLTLARLRHENHLLSSCKYDSSNKKGQPLINAFGSCGVEILLDIESLVQVFLTLSLKISSHVDKLDKRIREVGQSFRGKGSRVFCIPFVRWSFLGYCLLSTKAYFEFLKK